MDEKDIGLSDPTCNLGGYGSWAMTGGRAGMTSLWDLYDLCLGSEAEGQIYLSDELNICSAELNETDGLLSPSGTSVYF